MKREIQENRTRSLVNILLCGLLGMFTLTAVAQAQTITFITQPYDPATATAASGVSGQAYSYDAEATASVSGGIKYSLRYGPNGMTVNQGTGRVSWTPSQPGTYLAEIRAELANTPSVSVNQSWAILVTECDGDAIIQGRVEDQNGSPIASGTITAQIVGTTRSPLTKVTGDIVNGQYSLVVDQATYVLRVEGDGIVSTWYGDVLNFADAAKITTACQSTTSADIQVFAKPSYELGDLRISGRVVRSNDDLPMNNAMYRFFSIPRWQLETSEEQWRLKLKLAGGSFTVYEQVQSDGTFNVNGVLYNGNELAYFPVAYWPDPDPVYTLYRQYPGFTSNPIEAVPLIGDGDTLISNVNYYFEVPDTNGRPCLLNLHEDNSDIAGRPIVVAYAVRQTPHGLHIDPTKSAVTTNSFNLLPAGDYVLFAIPWDTNYVPGFYRKDDTAALSIDMATVISTDTLNPSINVQINTQLHILRLRRKSEVPGTSDIRGRVNGISNRVEKNGHTTQAISSLMGAFIYALDSTGQVAAYTFTNDDGSYLLKGIGKGDYTVQAAKPGYQAEDRYQLPLTGEGEIAEADFTLVEETTSSVSNFSEMSEITTSIHPNPAKDEVTLNFNGIAGTAHLKVVSTTGENILSEEIHVVSGKNSVMVDIHSLPSGTYLVTITGADYQGTSRFTIAR